MKWLNVILVIFFLFSGQVTPQTDARPSAVSTSKSRIDKRLNREINKAEDQFEQAIHRRDVTSLDQLLADYYADTYEGSERALSKRAALARCGAGTLDYYKIEAGKKLTVRGDIIQVEGIARTEQKMETDMKTERDVHLKRLWTKKNGRWLLIAQILKPIDSPSGNNH